MQKGITKIINQRYPISESRREIFLSSFFIAVMGYLFLIVFQPFGAHTFTNNYKYLLLAPYPIIAFVVYSGANLFFLKKSYNWNLNKELVKLLIVLLICSGFNYVYNIYFINHVSFSISHLLFMCLYTFAIAVPISMVYVLARYLYLTQSWNTFEEVVEKVKQTGELLNIIPDSGQDGLTLTENDFLYAESDGNYVTVHCLEEGVITNRLLRLSLKNLETQIQNKTVIRCHRSFIVNTGKVIKVKGNAQGYKLFIDGITDFVPVSRNYIPKVKVLVKTL